MPKRERKIATGSCELIGVPRIWPTATKKTAIFGYGEAMYGFTSIGRFGARLGEDGEGRHALPVEFFSHELMEVDPSDVSSVQSFCEEYGMPYHPRRFGCTLGGIPDFGENEIKVTTDMFNSWAFEKKSIEDEAIARFMLEREQYFLSFEEASAAIAFMQEVSNVIQEIVLGKVDSWPAPTYTVERFVNTCSRPTCEIVKKEGEKPSETLGEPPIPYGHTSPTPEVMEWFTRHNEQKPLDFTVTNAIANQMLETIADQTPWKICAAPNCNRAFKYSHELDPDKPRDKRAQNAKYCCVECREAGNNADRTARRHEKKERDKKASALAVSRRRAAMKTDPTRKGVEHNRGETSGEGGEMK